MSVLKTARHLIVFLLAVILFVALPSVAFANEDSHTVAYVVDGEVLEIQEVAHGGDAVAPEIPEKTGYTQISPQWSSDGKNITTDTTIEAEYTLNEYTITYKIGTETYKVLSFLHGENVVMLPVPERAGYIGSWDKTIELLTDNVVVNAVYTEFTPVVSETQEAPEMPNRDENKRSDLWVLLPLGTAAIVLFTTGLLRKRRKR